MNEDGKSIFEEANTMNEDAFSIFEEGKSIFLYKNMFF